jgi:hypothetical protein
MALCIYHAIADIGFGGYISGVAAIAAVVVAFVWWRYSSVYRGAQKRDELILRQIDPIGEKLARGEAPTSSEIEDLAKKPFARPMLYRALKHYERLDLFPPEHETEESQAASFLAYWMMHPNELQDAPEVIELLERVDRSEGGTAARFYVFRYRMPIGHWAGTDWLIGVSGPFTDNVPPYEGIAGAFSFCSDKYGETKANEAVDRYINILMPRSG